MQVEITDEMILDLVKVFDFYMINRGTIPLSLGPIVDVIEPE